MGSPLEKKGRIMLDCFGDEDRLSTLPDELIHKVLSFVDAKVAVQTSVLSKRWKLIWATLPFLSFGWYNNSLPKNTFKFISHVLSKRNHHFQISELKLCVPENLHASKLVEHAILHDVQDLSLDVAHNGRPYKLSTLRSNSIKKLTLRATLKEFESESDCWDLPALTTLHLKHQHSTLFSELTDSFLTCLPSLRTLCIDDLDLTRSSFSFSLPYLTTLCLSWCKLDQMVWNFPALSSLNLYDVNLPMNVNMSDIFTTLVNLQNLTLFLRVSREREMFISCPQLLNLTIRTGYTDLSDFVVLAPKLRSFSSTGIFRISFGFSELENVNINLRGWAEKWMMRMKRLNKWFTNMLPGLGNAKYLTFDLESIKALSEISDFLLSFPSPFYNLKYVKLPQGYEESSMPNALRSYLLGGSPRATIVAILPQNNMIPQSAAVSVTAENPVLQVPMTTTLEGTSNERMSSSKGNADFGLWRGHEVNSEFVCLLDSIMHKYPETFEHFTTTNKKLCTVRLNMVCTSLNEFTKISMTEVTAEIIAEYRDIFAFLQKLGFHLSWIVSRLNNIQHLRFSNPLITELHAIDHRINDAKGEAQDPQARVDDATNKLQNLQSLRAKKMTEIQQYFGTAGANLAVGFIGDDLLSGP